MRATEEAHGTAIPQLFATIGVGVIGGVLAAMAMGAFVMLVSAAVKHTGFFTPMYHVASAFVGPKAMMASMAQAQAGDPYYWTAGPGVLGMIVHLATGATFGVTFTLLARAVRLRGLAAIPAGIVYGLLVLVFMSFVALPLIADALGAGEPISDMPSLAGWLTFSLEHVVYGLVLGLVAAMTLRRGSEVRPAVQLPREERAVV